MSEKMYKLTDQNMQTYNGCQWKIGEKKTTSGDRELCGPGWLHCYSDLLLAILLNPIHADIQNPRLFVAEASGKAKHDRGLKSGYTEMVLVSEIAVPEITTEQRVKFAILCALEVYRVPDSLQNARTCVLGAGRGTVPCGGNS